MTQNSIYYSPESDSDEEAIPPPPPITYTSSSNPPQYRQASQDSLEDLMNASTCSSTDRLISDDYAFTHQSPSDLSYRSLPTATGTATYNPTIRGQRQAQSFAEEEAATDEIEIPTSSILEKMRLRESQAAMEEEDARRREEEEELAQREGRWWRGRKGLLAALAACAAAAAVAGVVVGTGGERGGVSSLSGLSGRAAGGTGGPTGGPTEGPTEGPTGSPTGSPTVFSAAPSVTFAPSGAPSDVFSGAPSVSSRPSVSPTEKKQLETFAGKFVAEKGLVSTRLSLNDETSPQFQALLWLQNDPVNEGFYGMFRDLQGADVDQVRLVLRQRFTAAVLYYGMAGSAGSLLADGGWMGDKDVCQWDGIVCDTRRRLQDGGGGAVGVITSLNLSNKVLSGSIPPEISMLTELRILSLWGNRITGTIPMEFFQNDDGTGSGVPLSNLVHLDLEDNDLAGPIPTELGLMVNLEELYLGVNSFDGPIPVDLLTGLASGGSLKVLGLGGNGLEGNIPPEVAGLTMLEELQLEWNQLDGVIPDEIYNGLTSLKILKISNNGFTGQISDDINNLVSLEEIHFGKNSLTGPIPTTIYTDLTNLTILDVESNSLTGPIDPTISNLTLLRGLYLSGNAFTGELPTELGMLLELEDLWLGPSGEGGGLTGGIPTEIGALTSVRALYLDHTEISGNLPTEIGAMASLEILDMSGNTGLSGIVPMEMSNLTNLRKLYLGGGTQFDFGNGGIGSGVDDFPLRIATLEVLSLPESGYERNLPNDISTYLPSLTKLDLSNNLVNGEIPIEIGSLNRLKDLNLSNNNLDGPIPEQLLELDQIRRLDLSMNSLTGIIPNGEGRGEYWSLLTELNLSANDLTGSIPTELGMLLDLSELNLSANGIDEGIPTEIGLLEKLEILDLSNNYIGGEIPSEIGMISTLRVLNLNNMILSSTIPENFGYLTNLEELRMNKNRIDEDNYQSNGITGTIPIAVVENLNRLWILHLAFNSLTGPIPNEISGLTSIETLLLSHNQLDGIIPIEFVDLVHLTTFKCFNNQIVGPVSEEICESRSGTNSSLTFDVGDLECSCCT